MSMPSGRFRGWPKSAIGALFLDAHDLLETRHAVFEPPNPGAAGVTLLMILAKAGVAPERWFARDPATRRVVRTYVSLLARELALGAWLFGPGFPRPELVEPSQIGRIVDWVARHRRGGRRTCVRSVASSAVRVARAAGDQGATLEGLTFVASGEPVTEAKRRVIEGVGAKLAVMYGFEPGSFPLAFLHPGEWRFNPV